jgi:hypothetical protein
MRKTAESGMFFNGCHPVSHYRDRLKLLMELDILTVETTGRIHC